MRVNSRARFPLSKVFTGKVPFPEVMNVQVIIMMSRGERPPKPLGCEIIGLVPALWRLTEECWHQTPERRPDIANVSRRFEAIDTEVVSPFKNLFRRLALNENPQQRINKLDQVRSSSPGSLLSLNPPADA